MNSVNIKLRKGDTVKVLAGKDKSKTAKIIRINRKKGMITVEGVNLLTRHQRPRRAGQKGQRVKLPAPMHPAKLMLICPRCGKPTRIGHQITQAGKKLRMCKKCKGTFE